MLPTASCKAAAPLPAQVVHEGLHTQQEKLRHSQLCRALLGLQLVTADETLALVLAPLRPFAQNQSDGCLGAEQYCRSQ